MSRAALGLKRKSSYLKTTVVWCCDQLTSLIYWVKQCLTAANGKEIKVRMNVYRCEVYHEGVLGYAFMPIFGCRHS